VSSLILRNPIANTNPWPNSAWVQDGCCWMRRSAQHSPDAIMARNIIGLRKPTPIPVVGQSHSNIRVLDGMESCAGPCSCKRHLPLADPLQLQHDFDFCKTTVIEEPTIDDVEPLASPNHLPLSAVSRPCHGRSPAINCFGSPSDNGEVPCT
jgi:hypothetical protein